MAQKMLQTGKNPTLIIDRVEGNLVVRGWERPELLINYDDEENLTLNQTGETISLRCDEDCTIQAPHGTTLQVRHVEGDGQVHSVQGEIQFGQVDGNLQLRNVGMISLEQVDGDFLAKQVQGDLRAHRIDGNANIGDVQGHCLIENIDGDAQLQAVQGDVKLEQVSGSLRLREIGAATIGQVDGDFSAKQVRGDLQVQQIAGNADVSRIQGRFATETIEGDLTLNGGEGDVLAKVEGNAALQLALPPGREVRITAEGDITCQIPPAASAKFHLMSESDILINKLAAPTRRAKGEIEFIVGAGEASLVLVAEGNIVISGSRVDGQWGQNFENEFNFGAEFGPEFGERAGEFAQQIASQIEQQVSALTRQLDEKLATLGTGDELASRVQEKVQAAMRKAEEKISEAMRNAERRAQEAERRAAEMDVRQRRQGWGFTPPVPPVPPVPPRAPKAPKMASASDEERLMILRMVGEGKISVEQAEQLLAALSG